MRALRLGSYSTAATFAGTPSFWRRKSIRRYAFLWPPPRWRTVMLPVLLRPLCFLRCSTRERSGLPRVTSSNVLTDMKRRPGLVGLYFLTGIRLPRRVLLSSDLPPESQPPSSSRCSCRKIGCGHLRGHAYASCHER